MRKPRHTEEERRAIIARTLTSRRPIAEIAAAGISPRTIQSWMRAPKRDAGGFIEVSPPRATIVELSFTDGTVLRIQG